MGWRSDLVIENLTQVTPESGDLLVIEDVSDDHKQKKIPFSAITGGGGGCAELLMQDGVTAPPVPIETEDRDDWLYEECSGSSTSNGGSSSTADEDTYLARQAALLDPDAYTWQLGSSWSVTVPTGKAYYLIGAWNVEDTARFHRRPYPMVLSEGTVIESNGNSKAFAYYCDPSAVTATRAKYYERLMRLEELEQFQLVFSLTSSKVYTTFPTDFDNGLVIGASVQDIAWIGLSDATENWTLNIWDEVSDDHGIRYGGPVMVPFDRSTFDRASAQPASDHSLSSGTGVLTYVKLPADW